MDAPTVYSSWARRWRGKIRRMRKTLPVAVARTIGAVCVLAVLGTGISAQSKPEDLIIATSGGTFNLVPLASLTNEAAVVDAERVAELALPAAQADVTAAKKEVDTIDRDIKTNFEAMEKEKEILSAARLAFQPTIDAYTKDLDALHADDAQFSRDKAPLQTEVDAYNAIPEKDRTEAQYKRLAALKAPFDLRWNAILARKAALDERYKEMSKALEDQEQPVAKLQEIDLELLAQRKAKIAALGEAYRQLQACYLYTSQLKGQLERKKLAVPPTLGPILESADRLLKGLASFGFNSGK